MSQLMNSEAFIRVGAFFGVFMLMGVWELRAPLRSLSAPKWLRWSTNWGLVILDTLVLRLAFPVAAIGTAAFAAERGWGLFNNLPAPYWLALVASVIVLDLAIYFQHVMFHAVPVLWRLHMVHHADLDFDVTTGFRFHPGEIVLSMAIKMAVVALLGPPVTAVMIFEVLLNATSMFNHSNVHIPKKLDRALRLVVVTPDMHRVHHSIDNSESNSNFGFNLPWWDRLLGTYRAQPAAGHQGMTIGLTQFQPVLRQSLIWLLLLPFTGAAGDYPINRRHFGG